MGHTVSKGSYKDLQKKIDGLVTRSPANDTLFAILKELYSEEEAEVIAKMPYGLSTIDRIAKLSGLDKTKLQNLLEGLAHKGLVIDLVNEGTYYYMPSPMVIGIFEFTMMRRGADFDVKKISKLFHKYLSEDNSFYTANINKHADQPHTILRTIPYEESVHPDQFIEVMDFEKASWIVDQADRFGVGYCSCRHEKHHTGDKKCDVPLETCLSLGYGVDYLVRNDLAREISKEEMKDIMVRSKEMGLIFSADNVQKNIQYMCQCCGCCCNYIGGLNNWGLTEVVLTSNWIAQPDQDKCNGCGACSRACPVSAIEMKELDPPVGKKKKEPVINQEYCIGCGVCTTKCKKDSMFLVAREQRMITPTDAFEKTILQALQRGTLQNLIFDNPNSGAEDFMRGMIGGFLRLKPVQQALMSDTLRSRFLSAMRVGVKAQGNGWMTEL